MEPLEYILSNKLSFCEGNVIKYITRHRKMELDKGIEALQKAKHYIDVILEETYGITE